MSAEKYFLSEGSHESREKGMCAMEWTAYIAGEPHTDQPQCVSPVLKSFCIRLNDRLGDEDRQKLRPYLARCIGTAGDGMDDERLRLCREFLFRRALPAWLELAGQNQYAEEVRSMPLPANRAEARTAMYRIRAEARKLRAEALDRVRAKYGPAAAAVADADADADAVAAAVADAVAVAVADAAAAAAVYDGTYKQQVYDRAMAAVKPLADELNRGALALLDAMLPTVPVAVPALPGVAEELCRV